MNYEAKLESTRKIKHRMEHELRHGITDGMVFKYDLPVVNTAIKFRNDALMV